MFDTLRGLVGLFAPNSDLNHALTNMETFKREMVARQQFENAVEYQAQVLTRAAEIATERRSMRAPTEQEKYQQAMKAARERGTW
jgi:hypothetical protein